jgi:hypothetical protein
MNWRSRAPRVLSRVPHGCTRLDVPGPVPPSQVDLRPEEHGGQERQYTPWTVPMK